MKPKKQFLLIACLLVTTQTMPISFSLAAFLKFANANFKSLAVAVYVVANKNNK